MINQLDICIWGRDFSVPVDYNCYAGESLLPEQMDAINTFITHPAWLETAKSSVEQYCRDQVMEDAENSKKENVFSYIKPQGFFVKREQKPRIALMCKYRYDIEHGIAVVFDMDGSVTVGPQDIIL